MNTDVRTPPSGSTAAPAEPGNTARSSMFGLPTATALVVGSVIGTGVLP